MMFIPGCTCCGTPTPECPCACPNGIPPFYIRVAPGSPTSSTGPTATAAELFDINYWLTARFCGGPIGDGCGWLFNSLLYRGANVRKMTAYNYGQYTTPTSTYTANQCTAWDIRFLLERSPVVYPGEWITFGEAEGSTYYAGVTAPDYFGGFKAEIHSNDQTKDLTTLGQMCSITGEAELPFWSASQASFTVTIRRDFSEARTVLQYGNAKFYRGPGCPICACNAPCSRSATLAGVTYDCLPPELTVDISLTLPENNFPDEGSTRPGANLTGSAMQAVNDIPAMTVPLVAWDGNAATYRYDYPIYSTTYLRYEVTLYCSTVCQPSQSLSTACVKAWLINKSTATPTPAPEWPITSFTAGSGSFSKSLSEASFWYTGNWIAGAQLPTPDLTINATCTGDKYVGKTVLYDTSGDQDSVSGSRITAGLFNVGGNNIPVTVYMTIANISVGVP